MSSGKDVDRLSRGVGNINLGSSESGPWEEVSRKQKNKAGQPWVKQTSPKVWGQPDTAQRLGMHSASTPTSFCNAPTSDARRQGGGGMRPQPVVSESKPLTGYWAVKAGSSQARDEAVENVQNCEEDEDHVYSDDDDDDDDDDEDLLTDEYDSDEGPISHEARKSQRMLKGFFEILDALTVPAINEPERQWHCPVCKGGPGAIDWYKGIQPLITHARTKGSIRPKLHRDFANLLDEELRRRGTSAVPSGESFGQWEGLKHEIKDHDIVWPPMVVITNTFLEKDDNDKWSGMGNQELLDYFRDYTAGKARHSYGPKGHRGISVLIFDSSAMGYVEAERLHKHFLGQGTGRSAWEMTRPVLFYPGGKRQLYGFLARKDDLVQFNRHCQGKTKLKYEIRSYQEMVVTPMKQMNEDNQQLTYYKNKVVKEQRNAKALGESLTIMSNKLRMTMEENRLVRKMTKEQHEQNQKEMDAQEQFFSDQINIIHESTKKKEDDFEKLQQDMLRRKVEEANADASDREDHRAEEVTKYKKLEMEKFADQKEELIGRYEMKKIEMKKQHWEEEVQLERELEADLTKLMDNYVQHPAEETAAAAAVHA